MVKTSTCSSHHPPLTCRSPQFNIDRYQNILPTPPCDGKQYKNSIYHSLRAKLDEVFFTLTTKHFNIIYIKFNLIFINKKHYFKNRSTFNTQKIQPKITLFLLNSASYTLPFAHLPCHPYLLQEIIHRKAS